MLALGQLIGVLVALASYIFYQCAYKPVFLSASCALTGFIDCPVSVPVHGYADKEYKEAYDIFISNFKEGRDIGAAMALYVDGQKVIDVQAGWHDKEKKIEYNEDTLQMVFSSTKALSAIVIAHLVDQGLLSYEEKIATYWPEFAQGNKENVTLMDLMRHTSGVCGFDQPLSYENITNSAVFSDILARQPHNFDGEPIHCYHAVTQGWYQNEIIRRVDPMHRTIDDFAQEFNKNYNIEWYLKPDATPGVDINRISEFYEVSKLQQYLPALLVLLDPRKDSTLLKSTMDKNSLFTRMIIHSTIDQVPGVMNKRDPKRRAIEGPSYAGHTNANSIAKLAAMLANEGQSIVEGEPNLFSKDTFENMMTFIGNEPDVVFPHFPPSLKGGLLWMDKLFNSDGTVFMGGSSMGGSKVLFNLDDTVFIGGGGVGGSTILFNPEYKIGFGYITNSYSGGPGPDPRTIPILASIVQQVKKQKGEKV